jgi:predicted porin
MTNLRISVLLAIAGSLYAAEAWAADLVPMKAPEPVATSTPKPCTSAWDFAATNCQLTWDGITVFGAIDFGFGWQTNGAPFDRRSAVGASYLIQKQNRGPMWSLAPNGLSNSYVGIKGTKAISEDFNIVFDLDAGFDPYSFLFSNGPGSVGENRFAPQDQNHAYSDSSRAGQFYNGQGYVGVSSPTYGTLTVFRQNALTLDAVFDYDPFGASYAFSVIGFQGITCGGGNTQNCRHSTALKYRVNVGEFRAAAFWQFGGYTLNNSSNGAYQFSIGADIPTRGKDVLSVDAIYSHVTDGVAEALVGPTNAAGAPLAPFSPQTLTATISDNTAFMFVAKYTTGPLKLFAGYEHIRFSAPSDPQSNFTDVAGTFVCAGCAVINSTNINNAAFGVNGLGDRILQIMWTGVKYAVTDDVDVIGAYYHYIQDSFFTTPCFGQEHSQCAGTLDAFSAAVDWRFAPKWDLYFGAMYSQENGGLANGFLHRGNFDPTLGVRFRF